MALSGAAYRFHYFVSASVLANYLDTNASGAVFLFSDEHVTNFGTPKVSKLFHIPLINSEIVWVSRKSAEDRRHASGYIYFFSMLHDNPVDGWVTLGVKAGSAMYFDPMTGRKGEPGLEYRLSLGDVRESARLRINGKDVRTLFAVPFEAIIGSFLHDGENTLEIDVMNLPANRIADYDRRGVEWRVFHDINFVSITYKPTLFDHWHTVPSGLLGPVIIEELKPIKIAIHPFLATS